MSFYKIRQKSTGKFYKGQEKFVDNGFVYKAMKAVEIGISSIRNNRKNIIEVGKRDKKADYQERADLLLPENIEVVEFKEVEVGVVATPAIPTLEEQEKKWNIMVDKLINSSTIKNG